MERTRTLHELLVETEAEELVRFEVSEVRDILDTARQVVSIPDPGLRQTANFKIVGTSSMKEESWQNLRKDLDSQLRGHDIIGSRVRDWISESRFAMMRDRKKDEH